MMHTVNSISDLSYIQYFIVSQFLIRIVNVLVSQIYFFFRVAHAITVKVN